MTKIHERTFAWVMVVVAIITAVMLSVVVVAQSLLNNNNTPVQQSQTSTVATCNDPGNDPVLPAPDAYKPTGKIEGLQIQTLEQGTGAAAKPGDCLLVKYYGTLATTGVMFDENFTKSSAFPFHLGQGEVIKGWDTGLLSMKVGEVRRLVIPAAMAYGDQSPTPAIPANSDLVFVVKLLQIIQ